jgi:hypothetical protein
MRIFVESKKFCAHAIALRAARLVASAASSLPCADAASSRARAIPIAENAGFFCAL